MNFKEFVELTRPVIGGKGGVHIFVRSLFDAILTDGGRDILDDYSDNTYKAYANGKVQITKIAKAMGPYLDQMEFSAFIYETEEAAQVELSERFRPYLPGINAHNVGESLADLFATIIREAAGAKRKSPASPKDETGPMEVTDGVEEPSGIPQDDGKLTVIQQQINVIQSGEQNFHLTNNGTMNFNF